MTLDEAIEHTLEIANKDKCMLGRECREDHLQLAKWLIELKIYRCMFRVFLKII